VPDLLAGLVSRRHPGQRILGFAAQSGECWPRPVPSGPVKAATCCSPIR
jgi:hypothetical protein